MITAGAKTSGKSDKFLKSLVKRLGDTTDILVGVPADATPYPDGTSVAMVGAIHEFGQGQQHERSFIRSTFDEQQPKYIKMAQKLIKKIVDKGGDIETVADLIGTEAAADVSDKIVTLDTPGNAESTKARKGSSNPLIDTGHLRQSIRHEVRTGRS